MNEELKKLQKMLEDIQKNLNDGFISKETYEAKVTELAAKIEELVEKQKTLAEQFTKRANAMSGLEDEKKTFSIIKAIKGVISGNWGDGYEKSVMDEYAKKAMSSTGSEGGYTIPPQAIMQIIEVLKAEAVVIKAGATVMNDLMGSPVTMPRQTTQATAYWVAENSAITASDLAFGQLSMTPKECAALVKLSAKLVMLSNTGMESFVQQDIAGQIALALDLAALRGSGSSNEPEGLLNAGIGTHAIGANGGILTFEEALKMEGVVEDAKALRGNLNYVSNPKVFRLMKRERIAQYTAQTNGQYVILPMSDQNLKDALGYDFLKSTQIPTTLTKGSGTNLSEVYFGDWRQLIIAQWGGLQIASSNVAGDNNGGAFSSNQVWIRAIQEVDIGVRQTGAFVVCTDAQTVS